MRRSGLRRRRHGLDYVLGRHPVSNLSYVSSVRTQSKLIAYGNNRADYTFVPGGRFPALLSFNPTSRSLLRGGPSFGMKTSTW